MTTKTWRGIAITAILAVSTVSGQELSDTDPAAVAAAINEYRSEHEHQIINDFIELLSIPNVALNLDDMNRNAAHITGLLESRGFEVSEIGIFSRQTHLKQACVPGTQPWAVVSLPRVVSTTQAAQPR